MSEHNGTAPSRPPRDQLVRAIPRGLELRDADPADANAMPTLAGRFAVFNQWTEIDSIWEGRFLERIAPGAFKKTFRENRDGIRVLFQHGQDPQIGDKPLGPITDLREDSEGAAYEVPLLDTSYNRDLLPGLEAGLYGASFRFGVIREDLVKEPKASDYNPGQLPERTIREARVAEFGPVTFPAYAGATAGVRSLSDEFLLGRFLREPDKLERLLGSFKAERTQLPDRIRAALVERADIPSLQALMCAWEALEEFKAYEDDPDDGPDREKATAIQAELEALMGVEANEDEGAEDEGAEDYAPAAGAGRSGHPEPARREPKITFDSREEYLAWLSRT